MALKHVYGNGTEGFQAIVIENGSTDVVTFGPFTIIDFDNIGIQLIGLKAGREIEVNVDEDDGVVQSTKTWTLANGDFTAGDEGDSFVVSGTVSNDGTYTIDTVVDSHTFTTVEAPGADETFGRSALFWITDVDIPSLVGTWGVQVSNSFTPSASGLDYSQDSGFRGRWTDITTQFSPTIATLVSTTGIADTTGQYIQANPMATRCIRVQFTPNGSTGGTAIVHLCAKSIS